MPETNILLDAAALVLCVAYAAMLIIAILK